MNPDPIAILEGAPSRELAKEFVNYVLGPDGQKLWFLKRGAKGGRVRQRSRLTLTKVEAAFCPLESPEETSDA